MRLRSQLHILGNKSEKEIKFHLVGTKDKEVIIEVEDYDKIWDYLLLLEKNANEEEFASWKKEYSVTSDEVNDINNFLRQYLLLDDLDKTENVRFDNFLSNYFSENEIRAIRKTCVNKRIMVIGLGTVGAGLVTYLQQFGIKNFVFVEDDVVAEKNLFHQRNFYRKDIGCFKSDITKKRVQEKDPNCSIVIYKKRIQTLSDLIEILEQQSVDDVFCCFDNHTMGLLNQIYLFLKSKNIRMYLSGYNLSAVKAYKVNENIIQNELEFEKSFSDVITDNAGLGFQGDIAAILMIRLWLQEINPFFEMHKESLYFDFLSLENEQFSKEIFEKNELPKLKNEEEKKFWEEYVLFPTVLDEYINFMCESENRLQELQEWCEDQQINIFDSEEREMEEYQEILGSLKMNYREDQISIIEYSQIVLKCREDNVIWNSYKEAQKPILNIAIRNLINKKRKYGDVYGIEWIRKREIKNALLYLAKNIAEHRYEKKMDFLEYRPFESEYNYNNSLENKIRYICDIDKCNPFFSYGKYIKYCLEHRHIHFVSEKSYSMCVRNQRFNTSEIIVVQRNVKQDIFDLIHELGHGYYNTYCNKNAIMDDMTSEIFSLLSEYRLMNILVIQKGNKEYVEAIRYRLQGIIIGMFSLDLYEEEVLKLEEINLENILLARKKVNKSIFSNIELINDSYSEYNMFMNSEMVVGKRNVYMYPEALLNATYLYNMIEKNPELEIKLINYLEKEQRRVDIHTFYKDILGLVPDYYEAADGLIKFWEKMDKLIKHEGVL